MRSVSRTETFAFAPVPSDLHHLVLNVFGKAFLQRLGDHRDLVPENSA